MTTKSMLPIAITKSLSRFYTFIDAPRRPKQLNEGRIIGYRYRISITEEEMMTQQQEQTQDPRRHVQNVQQKLEDLIRHLRQDVGRVDDPKAEALFETTAEVLGGLKTAYQHFSRRSEEAWR